MYTLSIHDAEGNPVSTKRVRLYFDTEPAGFRVDEYQLAVKVRELYRDAVFTAGKLDAYIAAKSDSTREE